MHIVTTIFLWFGMAVGGLFVLVALLAVLEAVLRWSAARRRAHAGSRLRIRDGRGTRTVALLVDVDWESGLFRASVQILGRPLVREASVRLELVDDSGTVRLTLGRSLSPGGIGAELTLPAFAPPPGITPEEVLGWRWDVVLEDAGGELGRWRERLAPAGGINPEAELEMPAEHDGSECSPRGPARAPSEAGDLAAFLGRMSGSADPLMTACSGRVLVGTSEAEV